MRRSQELPRHERYHHQGRPSRARLDAIPPDTLRQLVRHSIERYLPAEELEFLKAVEREERETLRQFIGRAA